MNGCLKSTSDWSCIADVTTIVNVVKEMASQNISIRRFVLDRGFFSADNIKILATAKIPVIIPLPFRLKLAKEILRDTRKDRDSPLNVFVHSGQGLFHTQRKVDVGGYQCDARMYLDPERKARETTRLLQRLAEIEAYMGQQTCETIDEAVDRLLNTMINRYGKHIIVSKANRLNRDEVLLLYRRRDQVEKITNLGKVVSRHPSTTPCNLQLFYVNRCFRPPYHGVQALQGRTGDLNGRYPVARF